jgi:hypothetical protein
LKWNNGRGFQSKIEGFDNTLGFIIKGMFTQIIKLISNTIYTSYNSRIVGYKYVKLDKYLGKYFDKIAKYDIKKEINNVKTTLVSQL